MSRNLPSPLPIPLLEPIRRRELSVLIFDVSLRERYIAIRHAERGMSQDLLKCKHIATSPQELDRKGVPEGMRAAPCRCDAGNPAQAHKQKPQSGARQRVSAFR